MHVHLVQGLVLIRMQEIEESTHLALLVVVPQILHKVLVAKVVVQLLGQEQLRADRLLKTLLYLPSLETWRPLPQGGATLQARDCLPLRQQVLL